MTRVAIIGAGFGGIAAAHLLRQAGFTDLTVFDRGDDVGGVWRDNTYPGCACDIPAPLYSYSFAVNPDWTQRFPPQSEILAYLRRCVRDFGLTPHLRLGQTITDAVWTGTSWRLTGADGRTEEFDVLIPALGQLSEPIVPRLEGAADFDGQAVHTAQWSPAVAVAGRRVGVIGTGASAIQLVPAIADAAASVVVFQRSAPWTLPKPNRRYGRVRRALNRRLPGLMRASRAGTWLLTVVTGKAVTGNPLARYAVGAVSRTQRFVQARQLGSQVRPDYAMGCKRVLFTGDWFRTLRRPDVRLVTVGIERLTATGVRTTDGVDHPLDLLVYGTGFAATEFLASLRVYGRDGRYLADEWRAGAYAHLGIAVPGFPNLFLMYGPNTNTGNTSVVYFHEAQARYIVQAVRAVDASGPLEVRDEVATAFDAEMQSRLTGSIWSGCESWYRTGTGRIVTNWPGSAAEYRSRTRRFRSADYTSLEPAPVATAPSPART
ncbi:cation diffusion facilitator CzcD-associated flavoprotein CzcO [Hamadaea flava]|uniref:Flavin-containing monooxygenase n=1 Tax=Hamadaea flava TaxID=1742688 RepID=A0ABV8LM05_9ACTN|nr:NAD(P)/FAD-dependent oxidoreductase [Hamadaea flava]MCP2323970.1 cation diffusion facilitator CzcD-associated flavoprotein CzcO [Hamadaea flava]